MKINLSRLKSTFEVSSKIGATLNSGLNRLALTKEDKKMRDVFVDWLKNEGLSVRIDDIGNIYGRREGEVKDASTVMVGSHLDTQPMGGRFDGILGVLSALEVIRTLNDNNIITKRPIEIVNFTAEEGARYGIPMEGSGVITGNYSKNYIFELKDDEEKTFEQALSEIEYVGLKENRPINVGDFYELHIEQGPILERNNKEIGIVQGIKGVTKFEVSISGQTTHAAFPAEGRRDALVAASEMVILINEMTKQYTDMSTTVGVFEVDPSHLSMSTGQVDFSFDVRYVDDQIRKKAINIIREKIKEIARKREVDLNMDELWNMNGTEFSKELSEKVKSETEKLGYNYQYITSGAGHDAKFMKDVANTALIFTPSVKGLSHCEEEFTSYEDIEKATNVLLNAVAATANKL